VKPPKHGTEKRPRAPQTSNNKLGQETESADFWAHFDATLEHLRAKIKSDRLDKLHEKSEKALQDALIKFAIEHPSRELALDNTDRSDEQARETLYHWIKRLSDLKSKDYDVELLERALRLTVDILEAPTTTTFLNAPKVNEILDRISDEARFVLLTPKQISAFKHQSRRYQWDDRPN
jgi:hypothetical protein